MKTNQSQKNIPDEWQEIRLGEAVEYVKGFPFKSEDYVSSGIRIIRVSDLGRDYIHNRKMIFIDSKKGYEYSKWKLKEDDLIFTTVGSKPPQYDSLVGRVIRVSKSNEGNLLNQNAVLLRVKNDLKLNQVYIFNHFLTQRYIYFVEGIIRGNANQGSITLEDLFEFTFFIPPFNEQNRIVKILDVWDKAIKNLTTKVEIKKQVRKNLMRSLLSGKIRIDGLGTEWESTKLGNLICNVSARNKALKVFRVLSVTNKHGFVLPEKQFARVVASEDLSNYKIISRGDFAYNPSRINVGSLARLDDYEEGLLSPMYVAIKEQDAIEKILSTADKEITELEKKLSIIREQKRKHISSTI
jgi:type I restriction enzyme S subunit